MSDYIEFANEFVSLVTKTRQVEVVADEGRHIIGYGSREKGERFTLPEKFAKELVKQQPDAFEMVRAKKTEEVEHAD